MSIAIKFDKDMCFDDIECGEFFVHNQQLYIKVKPYLTDGNEEAGIYNAIAVGETQVESGAHCYIHGSSPVEEYDVEILCLKKKR
ncbi:hypothetical protein M2146_002568 [Lachnospiraceae bacterium PF1-22]